jgi:hypothetical protein
MGRKGDSSTSKGSAPLTVRGVMIVAKTLGVFTYDQTCKTLAPGEICTFSVHFDPISKGVLKGILKIQSDAVNKPVVQVHLTGRGL